MDVLIGWPGGDWQSTARIAGALVGSYFALLWVASILWAYRDIRGRTRDPVSHIVAVGIVGSLPLVGLPIYLALRPDETLQAVYDRQLEQEAILSELHSVSACPSCRRPVQDDFMVCPHCRTVLKDACHSCNQLMLRAWKFCPFCSTARETPQPSAQIAIAGEGEAAQSAAAGGTRRNEQAAAVAREPASLRPRRPAVSPATGEEPAAR